METIQPTIKSAWAELLTPDEVRKLIIGMRLFIRENPIMDFKYDFEAPECEENDRRRRETVYPWKKLPNRLFVLPTHRGNSAEVKEERTLSETDYEVLTEEESRGVMDWRNLK